MVTMVLMFIINFIIRACSILLRACLVWSPSECAHIDWPAFQSSWLQSQILQFFACVEGRVVLVGHIDLNPGRQLGGSGKAKRCLMGDVGVLNESRWWQAHQLGVKMHEFCCRVVRNSACILSTPLAPRLWPGSALRGCMLWQRASFECSHLSI